MKKGDKAKGLMIIIFSIATQVRAADILETVGGLNNLVYGIAAGLAALMITLHAIRWKTADNPSDREEAKRGMINVILALILIMIAGAVISVIYVKPPEAEPPTTSRAPTTRAPPPTTTTTTTLATSSTTTTTTSTTTTTIDPATLLTATNLAKCIRKAGGQLFTNLQTCPYCRDQQRVFVNDAADGQAAYNSIDKPSPSGGIPRWEWGGNSAVGCHSFQQLNAATRFDCKLKVITGHTYQTC
jgi:hypothetical protein